MDSEVQRLRFRIRQLEREVRALRTTDRLGRVVDGPAGAAGRGPRTSEAAAEPRESRSFGAFRAKTVEGA